MKYNIYDKDNIENAIKYYYKNKVSHKEVYEKFNIKRATYFTYLKIYKESDFSQTGGNKKYEEFEKTNNIFKKKESEQNKEVQKNVMEIMNNAGGRGGSRNKHSGFTDAIEQHKKKVESTQPQNTQQKKKKVVSLDEMYNISGFLNEQDKIAKSND